MKPNQTLSIIVLLTLMVFAPSLMVSGKSGQSQGNPFDEILTAIDELGSISVDLEPVLQTISDAVTALTASIEASRDAIMGLIEDTQTETIDEIQGAIAESEQATATAIDEAKDEAMNTMMTASRLFALSEDQTHVSSKLNLQLSISCDKPFVIKSIFVFNEYYIELDSTLDAEVQLETFHYPMIANYDLEHSPLPNVGCCEVIYSYGIYDGIGCPGGASFMINDGITIGGDNILDHFCVSVIIESALDATPSLTVELGPPS